METETFKIFDENKNEIGTATREDVHRLGYWHETFHCWFISKEQNKTFLYLQLRSETKKDYPNLLDITAAGHLLANEKPADGVREVEEEVGINVTISELVPLGLISYEVTDGKLIDREMAHTFLHIDDFSMNSFKLQEEEVAGMVKVEWNDFVDLWYDQQSEIRVSGFKLDRSRKRIEVNTYVGKARFVPHPKTFYHTVIERIQEKL